MIVRYWGFLLAKLAASAVTMWGVWSLIRRGFPHSAVYLDSEQNPFAHDLGYTSAMMLFFLVCVGLLYAVILDQRYRCRSCLRRLRMPVAAGSWPNMLLFGQPRTEYICLYGHGTLKVPEVDLTGAKTSDWTPNDDDIFKELEAIEAGRK